MEKNNKIEEEKNDNSKSIINKNTSKIKYKKYIILVVGILILGYFLIMEFTKYNEDLEAKIIGEKNSVNWSDTSLDIENSKEFKNFENILNDNTKKFDKTMIVFNQFNGCGSCIDKLLENINKNSTDFNRSKVGILLVTTLDQEYIDTVYKSEYKFVNIISDSEFQISKNLDMYNDEYNQIENCVLVFEGNNTESYIDAYYYEKDEEAINYLLSYIKNK